MYSTGDLDFAKTIRFERMAEELFDILTPTGVRLPGCDRKPRRLVHRDGDWHAAIHVWILAEEGSDESDAGPRLLLQKRAACKESWASMWDISAAGHITAGDESVSTAIREVEEELGIRLPADSLELLFVYRQESTDRGGAFVNNEFNDVYMCTLPKAIPVEKFDVQPEEVEAVDWFSVDFIEKAWREMRPGFVPQNASECDYGKLFSIIRERYSTSEDERMERLERACEGEGCSPAEDDFDEQTRATLDALRGSLEARQDESDLQRRKYEAFKLHGGPWRNDGTAFLSTADSPSLNSGARSCRADSAFTFSTRIAFPQRRSTEYGNPYGPTLDSRK